jgi:2-keto-4-pentenoate hydratase/2-oxohepta-3-ene-1,7-dioic acid hydratase in catechol pathway
LQQPDATRTARSWETASSISGAANALGRLASEVKDAAPDTALSQVTRLPPITDPDKIICAGRNYRAHAADVVEVEIDGGIDTLRNPILAEGCGA